MKKIVLSLAVLFTVAMVSCGGSKKAEEADTVDTIAAAGADIIETVDSANDTTVTIEAAGEATADSAAAQN